MYALICLSLALVGVAGLQFTYLFYLDRVDRERKKHMHDLQRQCRHLTGRLQEAEDRIAMQDELLLERYGWSEEEAWADVIDER